jgi:hypothetical protein
VSESDLKALTLQRGGEQALPLETFRHGGICHGGELRRSEGLAEGHEFEDAPLRLSQIPETYPDQLHESIGRGRRADHPPDAAVVTERSAVQPRLDQLAQEEDIPLATDGEVGGRSRIDRALKDGREELLDVARPEAEEIEPVDDPVLPQGHDGVRGRFTGADRGQDEGTVHHRQLLDQGGRRVIEEMGVVDEERKALSTSGLDESGGRASQEIGTVVHRPGHGIPRGREERGEGPEREAGR